MLDKFVDNDNMKYMIVANGHDLATKPKPEKQGQDYGRGHKP